MNKKQQAEADEKEEAELRAKPMNVFTCDQCKEVEAMEMDDFKKHLLEVHQITPDKIKGTKSMVMHLDGSFWYMSTYQWKLEGGLSFHQSIKNARDKGDMMRMP